MSVPDEGLFVSVPDEGYSSHVSICFIMSVPDEGYSSHV